MLRSAAKNYAVGVDDRRSGRLRARARRARAAATTIADLRRRLAEKVYAHTAAYDAAIAGWFAPQRGERFPEDITLHARARAAAALRRESRSRRRVLRRAAPAGLAALKQLGGKELSFNNLLDLEGALLATEPFASEACCAIVKHTTPCGIAVGATRSDAYRKALACDPVSAFGSVIAFTVPVDDATPPRRCRGCSSSASSRRRSRRSGRDPRPQEEPARARGRGDVGVATRSTTSACAAAFLVQERTPPITTKPTWKVVTERAPTDDERAEPARSPGARWRA